MAKYNTKKINGYNAVHIGELPLKYGRVSSQNSMPYIREDYIPKLMELDAAMGKSGNRYKITSNIGGSHKGGARSHANFEKMDIAPDQRAGFTSFNPAGINYLNSNWVGNGAIGYEGNHYDVSFNAKGGGMNNQPIFVKQPNMIDPRGQNANMALTGLTQNALYTKMLQEQAKEFQKRYDIDRAIKESGQAIQDASNNAVERANAQMALNTMTPEEQQAYIRQRELDTLGQRDIANLALANTMEGYNKLPTAQDNANFVQEQYNKLLAQYQQANPYLAAQGQVTPFQVDAQALKRAMDADRAIRDAQTSLAMNEALKGNTDVAKIMLGRAESNNAENLLKQANQAYQLQVANQLGLPPEVVKDNWDKLAAIYKEATPGMVSGIKESMTQPQQNWRTEAQVLAPTASDIAKTSAISNQGIIDALQKANQQEIDKNIIGGNIISTENEQLTKMYGNKPELYQKQLDSIMSGLSYPIATAIQGGSSITNQGIQSNTSAAGNINTNLTKEYETAQKSLDKTVDIAAKQAKTQEQGNLLQPKTTSDLIKLEIAKQKALADIKKEIVTVGNPNIIDPEKRNIAVSKLNRVPYFTDEEKMEIIEEWFPKKVEQTKKK